MTNSNCIDRRTALSAGAAAAALAVSPLGAKEQSQPLDIIDCHTHFYDPQRPAGVPWPAKGTSLYRTVLPDDFHRVPKFRPVTGTVIVEASSWVEDNAWLLELAEDDPFIVGIVGNLTPGGEEFTAHLKRFAGNELFRGIRISYRQLQALLEENNLKDLRQLADHDLALDVNGQLESTDAVPQVAAAIPHLRIVINHIGNVAIRRDPPPQAWSSRIQAAAEHGNVFCKISALVEGAARGKQIAPEDLDFYRPYIDTVWNAFGDERVIYGSNWPVSERAASYAVLQKLVLQYADEQGIEATKKFCSINAKRCYKWITR